MLASLQLGRCLEDQVLLQQGTNKDSRPSFPAATKPRFNIIVLRLSLINCFSNTAIVVLNVGCSDYRNSA